MELLIILKPGRNSRKSVLAHFVVKKTFMTCKNSVLCFSHLMLFIKINLLQNLDQLPNSCMFLVYSIRKSSCDCRPQVLSTIIIILSEIYSFGCILYTIPLESLLKDL